MIFALIGETWRNHRDDMARYHDRMDDFWREKRKERLWNVLFPKGRARGNWGAAERVTAAGHMAKQNRPAQRQLYKAQRLDLKNIIAWIMW